MSVSPSKRTYTMSLPDWLKSAATPTPDRPLLGGYEQMQSRLSRPRGEVRIRHIEHIIEGNVVSDATADLLDSTNSLTANGEFRQWLHIWNTSTENSRDAGHVSTHTSFPWVRIWDKPDLSLIMATHYITGFVNFPTSWSQLWYHLEELIEARRANREEIHGPYWCLMDAKPTAAFLAGKMAEMKRRIVTEMAADHEGRLRFEGSDKFWRDEGRRRFREALEPFRVMTFDQELEDETVRATEERGNVVPGGGRRRVPNRPALGRPPRCR